MREPKSKLIVFTIALIVLVQRAFSQDVHFSQFDAAPLYYNPALTGVDECNNRIYTNYKGQWNTYNTFLASYDQKIEKINLFGGRFGLGGLVVADYAGENNYGNTQIKIMPAYHHSIIPGKLRFSTGLDVIFNIMSGAEDQIVMNDGIDPITGKKTPGYDLEHTTKFYSDLGLGFNFQYSVTPITPINMGVTFFHLFGSGGGGLAVADSKLGNYLRFSLNANASYPLNTMLTLLPSFIYTNQKMYNEMNFGSYLKFTVGEYTPIVDAFYVGAWYRWMDALIIGLAFDKPLNKNWIMQLGLSYDVTLSSYRESNNWASGVNRGDSFELSLKFLNCHLPIIVNPEGIVNDPYR